MKTKKKDTIVDSVLDPVSLKTVIDTILDPKNPDSNKVRKEIIKGINNCIKKDTTFLTTIKGIIIDNGERITQEFVQKCMDEYKEQLTNALVTTVNIQCQDFFNERKDIINKILKKTLQDCVQDIIDATRTITEDNCKKIKEVQKEVTCTVDIPLQHKDEILNYIDYLSRKN